MRRRHPRYIMQDQIRDLVPDLVRAHPVSGRARPVAWPKLALFVTAVLAYIAALSLAA